MALTGKTASFPAISWVVTVLVAVGVASSLLRQHIPPPPPNALGGIPGDYMAMGAHQEIDWRPVGASAFAEARRLDRPILLAIGAAWSRTARLADQVLFSNQDVALSLRQDFVCIRADSSQTPAWATALVPLSRAQAGVESSFQIYFLDPTGALIGSILRREPQSPFDPATVRANLKRVREILGETTSPRKLGESQRLDIAPLVGQVRRSAPDFAAHRGWIEGQTTANGGIPVNGFQFLRPSVWRFLLEVGDIDLLRRSLGPVLRTGIVDWLDGGFFSFAEYADWRRVEFDKLAVANAEMAAVLAWAEQSTGDIALRRHRRATMRTLVEDFAKDRIIAGYRLSDEGEATRSRRSSFSPLQLRQRFTGDQRVWMATALGLDVRANPQMSIRVNNPADASDPRFQTALDSLRRAHRAVTPVYGGGRLLDAAGHSLARLFEAARWSGDHEWTTEFERMFDALRPFRAGPDDVVHSIEPDASTDPYLGDYLAYADAALGCFLATGRTDAFNDGLAVLRRALFVFGDRDPAIVVNARFRGLAPGLSPLEAPSLADEGRESTSATLVRLLDAYGRLSGDGTLVERARLVAGHLAWTANGVPLATSGLFAAAYAHLAGVFAVVVGPDSVSAARSLSSKAPGRLVAPGGGFVGRNLRAPGIYVFQGGRVRGPLSLSNAARALEGLPRGVASPEVDAP